MQHDHGQSLNRVAFSATVHCPTGWAIGDNTEPEQEASRDARDMYEKLERIILPLFYGLPAGYTEVRRSVSEKLIQKSNASTPART